MSERDEMAERETERVHEIVGGEPYAYYPLGEHLVAAPGVCGGLPTFQYTRIGLMGTLDRLAAGETIEEIVPAARVACRAKRSSKRAAGGGPIRAQHAGARTGGVIVLDEQPLPLAHLAQEVRMVVEQPISRHSRDEAASCFPSGDIAFPLPVGYHETREAGPPWGMRQSGNGFKSFVRQKREVACRRNSRRN